MYAIAITYSYRWCFMSWIPYYHSYAHCPWSKFDGDVNLIFLQKLQPRQGVCELFIRRKLLNEGSRLLYNATPTLRHVENKKALVDDMIEHIRVRIIMQSFFHWHEGLCRLYYDAVGRLRLLSTMLPIWKWRYGLIRRPHIKWLFWNLFLVPREILQNHRTIVPYSTVCLVLTNC